MGVKEKVLTAVDSITSGDFLRVVTSAGYARKIDYNKLAKAIVENYAGSSLAGSSQSLKAAIDSLNSNLASGKVVFTKDTLSTTQKTFDIPNGYRGFLFGTDSSATRSCLLVLASTASGTVSISAISGASNLTTDVSEANALKLATTTGNMTILFMQIITG